MSRPFARARPLAAACLLWCTNAFPHAQTTTTVQFDREIVHILDDHCVMCHEQDGPAFPLVTYEQTYAARWKIRQDVLDRHMTPWAAVPGYGEFANDNSLTQREIDFFVSWAESFGPRNDGQVYAGVTSSSRGPKVVQARVEPNRWAMGAPDLRLAVPVNTVGPAQGSQAQHSGSQVQRVSIDLQLKSDVWLRGLEYKPGDRKSIREVSFTVQETGQWIGAWTPWYGFVSLPDGLAVRLTAGSHLVATIYGGAAPPSPRATLGAPAASGIATSSAPAASGSPAAPGTLGLYFASAPSARSVANLSLLATQSPATAQNADPAASRKLVAKTHLDSELNVLAVEPLLLPGVQSIEISAHTPGGARQVLLFARDIPFEWPTPYIYAKPVNLPQGTEVSVIEHYANAPLAALGTHGRPVGDGLPVTFIAFKGSALPVAPVTQQANDAATKAPATPTASQRFKLTGTIQSVDADNRRIVVQHGDIPGFMSAMTMSYRVAPREDLEQVAAGDRIESDVVVEASSQYLENIKVTRRAR